MMACGTGPETADAATSTLNLINDLGDANTTKIVISHVAKTGAGYNGPRTPYGSVAVENIARSAIEVRRQVDEEDEDGSPFNVSEFVVTLRHAKSNNASRLRPIGLQFAFDSSDALRIRGAKPVIDWLSEKQTEAREREVATVELLRSRAMTIEGVASELGCSEEAARSLLRRLEKRGRVVRLPDNEKGGRGHGRSWGLKEKNRVENPVNPVDAQPGFDDEVPF